MPQPGHVLIREDILTSPTSNIVYSTLPNFYSDLVIDVSVKSTFSGRTDGGLRFNGDSGNNYERVYLVSGGVTTFTTRIGNQNGLYLLYTPGPNVPFTMEQSEFNIQNYNINGKFKSVNSILNDASQQSTVINGTWKNTSPITSITIFAITYTFDVGSRFRLWGIL